MGHRVRLAVLMLSIVGGAATGWALPGHGDPAPAFALRPLESTGQTIESAPLFEGKTTLLSFFATWCKPCKEEIPAFRRLADRYGSSGFQVVLVSLDFLDAKDVRAFLDDAGAGDLQVLWDEDQEMMGAYGFFNLPCNVVVGPDGKVVSSWQGYIPEKIERLSARLRVQAARGP